MRPTLKHALLFAPGIALLYGLASRVDSAPSPQARPGWEHEDRAVYVADLSRATPASALSDDGRPGTWKVVPFSTAMVSGKMLFSAPGRTAPVTRTGAAVRPRRWDPSRRTPASDVPAGIERGNTFTLTVEGRT